MNSSVKSVPLIAPGHTRPVTHLAFSQIQSDGHYLLASSCKDGNPMLRDWTGDWIGTFLGHKGAVWCTKLSSNEGATKAVSGSADFTAKVWDTHDGSLLRSFPHNTIVRTVAISPSSAQIVTGTKDGHVRIFDLEQSDPTPRDLCVEGDRQMVKSVVWITRDLVASAGDDGLLSWWDLRLKSPIRQLSFSSPVTSMELSSQTNQLVLTWDNTVEFVPQLPIPAPSLRHRLPYRPSSASVHPFDTELFVTGSRDDEWVRFYGRGGAEPDILKAHHGPVHCVEFSPDGEMYASGSEDGEWHPPELSSALTRRQGTIRLWQTTPGKTYGLWQGVVTND